ncbi:MAG: glycoside hydrolase family 9 protein [Chitinophagaceae bacterium]|nr:glycoside hydrolase family 9 protein [Chitinophagaceae bacterium]
MKKSTLTAALLFFISLQVVIATPPGATTKHIKIDQFGYLPNSRKVAVIADPQLGYNASESFTPGTGVNQYQVRRWSDDVVVFSGTLTIWNSGSTHTQSGDRGWWFDFSSVTTPGSYYIFDVAQNVGSYRFEIAANVYATLLKQAARMYFYQRVNFPKQVPYVDAKWSDASSFEGPNQDRAARSSLDKLNAATAKDVHGGWYDAGDYNKYTTFALGPLCNLLETYRMHPGYFTDDYNIPESGNGVPDILDEVKWELDFLTRMQDGTTTNGLFIKVGTDNFNAGSPPSTDNNPRYYVPECTSSTLTGAAVFALGSTIYKSLGIPSATVYGDGLLIRAINAWNRAKITTSNFNVFQTNCDVQDIKAGDADQGVDDQREIIVTAAAYLFEATGNAEYRNAFDTMYVFARPYANWWWGPYYSALQRALLRYTTLPGATATVANNIRTRKAGQNGVLSINDYNSNTDFYRSSMPDAQYHWNSHEVKANAGINNLDFVSFGINTGQESLYKEVAESYLHWFHGINPMGKVMLTNMYAFGADSSVNEFYHSWFGNGTIWDNVFTSPNGPAPGYLIGGPNKDFSIPGISPPGGQPPQKSYREWNTGWNGTANENSWEITEAGIYTQAAYISLLVRVMANNGASVLPLHVIGLSAKRGNNTVAISWNVSKPAPGSVFELQRSANGTSFSTCYDVNGNHQQVAFNYSDPSADANGQTVYYRIKEINANGSEYLSAIVAVPIYSTSAKLSIFPNPVNNQLQLSGHASIDGSMAVNIIDQGGKTVKRVLWNQSSGTWVKTIATADLAAGVYWLELKSKAGAERRKFVKQ